MCFDKYKICMSELKLKQLIEYHLVQMGSVEPQLSYSRMLA